MRKQTRAALTMAALIGWFSAVLWLPPAVWGQATDEPDEPAAVGAAKGKAKPGKQAKKEEDAETDKATGSIGIFAAVKKRQLEVQFVPQSRILATLTISNVSAKPITVRIPVVVAGAPTMPPGVDAATYLVSYGTAPPQAVGGVINRSGSGETAEPEGPKKKKKRPGGRPTAKTAEPPKPKLLRLAPGESEVIAVACVGLEFGKPDPLPVLPYSLVDIDEASNRPEVKPMLESFAQGKFDWEIAQLAAWHFGGMTWEQLADNPTLAGKVPAAMKAVAQIEKDIKAKAKAKGDKEKDIKKEKAKAKDRKNGRQKKPADDETE